MEAGRLVFMHGRQPSDNRSYSMASGEHDEHLQFLYRLIPQGKLTPQLAELKPGDPLELSGPFGEFSVRDLERPLVFVATGTGVAPCRAYIKSFPSLKLTLFHGTRVQEDLFYREEFEAYDYYPCVSREEGDHFHGRVTEAFRKYDFAPDSHFYLCGVNEMIFDLMALLKERGVDDSCAFTEAYYSRLMSVSS